MGAVRPASQPHVRAVPRIPSLSRARRTLALTVALGAGALPASAQAAGHVRAIACAPATSSRVTCLPETIAAVRSRQVTADLEARSASAPSPLAPSGEPAAGTPAFLQQAYDLSWLSATRGAGDTIAIVVAYDDPHAESDLAVYRATYGLGACTTANGCFRKVNEYGGTAYPQTDWDWPTETTTDLDAVSALCPRCHVLLVEATTNDILDLASAQQEAASLGANQISDSWGQPAAAAPPVTLTAPGVAVIAGSGDAGQWSAGTSFYPAALPNVTAVGGTTLTPADAPAAQNPRGFVETAWSKSGSGCDLTEPKPAWQSDPGCAGRAYADVSALADPLTGMSMYDSGGYGWEYAGGTSLATPLVAAYYALTGATGPQWLYAHAAQLNDITAGANGACAPVSADLCTAGPGYDGPTGVGSISGAAVQGAPGIAGPDSTPLNLKTAAPESATYAQDATATTVQLSAGVYPNGSDTRSVWRYGTSSAYGQQTPSADAGHGTAVTLAATTLRGLRPATTYHYRLTATNAYGTVSGYGFTFQTAPAQAPTIIGVTAATTTARMAHIRAQVNLHGLTGSCTLTYRTAGRTATRACTLAPAASGGVSAVRGALTGLSAGTACSYRLSVRDPGGFRQSPEQTFVVRSARRRARTARRTRPRRDSRVR